MRLPKIALTLFTLFSLPAAAPAGPIEFRLTSRGFWIEPGQPMLRDALFPTFEGGAFAVDPATGQAAMVGPLVDFFPAVLPHPRPEDLNPEGASIWRNKGNFRLDFTLIDVESGNGTDLSMWGRAHGEVTYFNGQWMYGGVTYWFGDGPQYHTISGKEYVLWGQQRFTGERPVLSVWVGDNPPFPWVPEPTTFALAALGLAPLALRRLRRSYLASAARCSTTSTSSG